jgi:type I restriction enzyme M protein
MSENYKSNLETQLWNIANTLRGKMNADEFRDYILGFIFYKYLSEKMNLFADDILQPDGIKFKDITPKTENSAAFIEAVREDALEKLGYFLSPNELFSELAKRGMGNNEDEGDNMDSNDAINRVFILDDLQKILINIQLSTMGTDSEEDFDNLFEDMDLNSSKLGKTPEARNTIIAKVLTHLDKIDFMLSDINQVDILGDAYEYLIGQFASGAGKKAGEFYTPQQVSTILAKLVTTGKQKLKSVYDPTCGSGSLLLRVAKEVENVTNFYGQEMNRTTYNLARMNMILHDVHYRKFDIKQDDTLEHPQHTGLQFEAIVANPPFSAQWSANPLFSSDDRFSQYGRLAPSSKADFAFVQHMIYHLADNGTMAIVLPHGALFRGGAEQHIRRYLIENKNFLDAVIGLPANIFYGTSIPTCILVFKKCREYPDEVLFIDASQHYEKVKTQNVLRQQDIELIIDTYRNRTEIPKYSKSIFIRTDLALQRLNTIESNDYNLNIPRYVDTFEAEEGIDLEAIANEMKTLDKTMANTDQIIAQFCKELNISSPF